MSIQAIIIELALWMFVYQFLAFSLPTWASLPLVVLLIAWRFGRKQLREIFGLKRVISLPVLFLIGSALYTESYKSLENSPNKTVIIPLQEELLYRYIVPKVIQGNSTRSRAISSIISTFMFAFAHRKMFDWFSPDMAVCVLVASALGFRTSYRNKNSIVESFIIHSLHNMHVMNTPPPERSISPHPFLFYGSMLGWDVYMNIFRK
jgi:membrane protease YdiL (CAAX protease family)